MVSIVYAKRRFFVKAILVYPTFKHLKDFFNKSSDFFEYFVLNGNIV